ncbi:MAG: tRNA lysidine(34) synthetase TilS [Lentilactobacillus buchneri]|nr:tRNA lysidine(34) synthetase TilS [Lentilactobacillus buchneri]
MISSVSYKKGYYKPVSLQQKFNQMVLQNNWWKTDQPVVVAVSTGIDSMTLLYLLEHLDQCSPQIIVAYVDHCLREQSKRETVFIQQYCSDHHLKLVQAVWNRKQHPQHGIEAAAREFRYRFFRRVLKENQATVLLTAHHGDDLAETMLMKLVRGGQIESLIGIAEQRPTSFGSVVRPLLHFSKKEIHQFASSVHIKWFEDETNRDLTIQRNRFRHQIVPKMKQENPRMLKHFVDYSKQLKTLIEVNQELMRPAAEEILSSFKPGCQLTLSRKLMTSYSDDVQISLVKFLIEKKLKIQNIPLNQFEEIHRLMTNTAKPQGTLSLPNGWLFIKSYQKLTIVKKVDNHVIKPKNDEQFMVILDRWYSLKDGSRFGVFTTKILGNYKITTFHLSEKDFPLIIRHWRNGDRLRLKNGGHQKVSRVLINAKIPQEDRLDTNVLMTSQDEILAVPGLKSAFFSENLGKVFYLIEDQKQSTSERKGIDNE